MPSTTEYALLRLTVKERNGIEIADAYEAAMGKAISLGTLYTTLRRLKDAGLIAVRDDEDEDGRVKWFQLTAAGARACARWAARAEALSGLPAPSAP